MTQILISIPNNELDFFQKLANKMGWIFRKQEISDNEIQSYFTDNIMVMREKAMEYGLADISLEEINAEIQAARNEIKDEK